MALGTEIALIKALGGGGSSLPPITAADAGKVLTATDSGVWGAQNPRNPLYAQIYMTDADADLAIYKSRADGTFYTRQEITDAVMRNDIIIGVAYIDYGGTWLLAGMYVLNPTSAEIVGAGDNLVITALESCGIALTDLGEDAYGIMHFGLSSVDSEHVFKDGHFKKVQMYQAT